MEVLGIGPLELFFFLIIALIVLGPKDMVKAGKTLGGLLRRLVKSPAWAAMQQTSREIRTLPNKLMRDAGLEESIAEVQQIGRDIKKETAMMDSLRHMSLGGAKVNTSAIGSKPDPASSQLDAWTMPKTGQEAGLAPDLADGLSAWTTPTSGVPDPPPGPAPVTSGVSAWTDLAPRPLLPDGTSDAGADQPISDRP